MQHRLLTDAATFRPVTTFAPLPLKRPRFAVRADWRVTFALAAITFAATFAAVAFA